MNLCDRVGCNNPNCKIYIPKIGNICEDCKNEFISLYDGTCDDEEIMEVLDTFMGMKVAEHKTGLINFFNRFKK